MVAQIKTSHPDLPHHFRTHNNTTTTMFAIASALTIRPAVKVTARKAVKVSAFYDPDQYDHDANSGRGSGFVATQARPTAKAASVSYAAKPTRVTRGADGVVYDPDQFDADANVRSNAVAYKPAGGAARAPRGCLRLRRCQALARDPRQGRRHLRPGPVRSQPVNGRIESADELSGGIDRPIFKQLAPRSPLGGDERTHGRRDLHLGTSSRITQPVFSSHWAISLISAPLKVRV